ncbi:hypothetical protein GBAR_LOCUS13899, partial [Geodia barretti]
LSLSLTAPGPLGAVTTEVSHDSQQLSDSRAVLRLFFQRPESCFPLNYTLTLSEEGGPEEVIAVQVTGSESEMVAEATGLKENSRYSATLSASNHFHFSIDDPMTTEVSFVTSGLQSVAVFHYENGTARITCVFATGSLSSGCLVSLVLNSSTTTTINIDREEGAVEVIHYSLIGGVPQSVTGRDLGVDNPLEVRGEVSDDPTATTDETDATSHVCSPEDLLFPGVDWTAIPEFTADGMGVYSFPGGNVTYNGVSLGSTATYRTSEGYLVNGVRILERRCTINNMWTAPELIISNAKHETGSEIKRKCSCSSNCWCCVQFCVSNYWSSTVSGGTVPHTESEGQDVWPHLLLSPPSPHQSPMRRWMWQERSRVHKTFS